jgi:hypothetical protein
MLHKWISVLLTGLLIMAYHGRHRYRRVEGKVGIVAAAFCLLAGLLWLYVHWRAPAPRPVGYLFTSLEGCAVFQSLNFLIFQWLGHRRWVLCSSQPLQSHLDQQRAILGIVFLLSGTPTVGHEELTKLTFPPSLHGGDPAVPAHL